MNILFVHEVDWLRKVVFEIHNISELLSCAGHRVFAVDYEDDWRDLSLRPGHLQTREVKGIARAVTGAAVTLRRPGFIRLPGLSRITAAVTSYREIERILRQESIDIIVLYAVPTSGMQTVSLAGKYGVPVVFRAIDILHRLVRYRALRSPTRILEKRVYQRVDKILAIAPRYARYVTAMGVPESRIKLVPLPVDTDLFKPEPGSADLRGKWGIHDHDRIIVFVGTLFNFSGLDGFIRRFPEVLKAVPEAQLLIVGDGPQRGRLEGIIAEMELEKRVVITGFQPYEKMPDYINLAEICINTFVDNKENEDIFPGKIIQYIACGRATVSTPLKGITSMLAGPSHGIVYAGAGDLAGAAVNLLQSAAKRKAMGQAGREYVLAHHGYQSIVRQFEAELEDVVREKRAAKERKD